MVQDEMNWQRRLCTRLMTAQAQMHTSVRRKFVRLVIYESVRVKPIIEVVSVHSSRIK